MGIISSNKVTSKDKLLCGESTEVTLSLSASPDLQNSPKEIVLILDRSGSMGGEPLEKLKQAAMKFLKIYDTESDGLEDDIISGGSKVALVSFSTTATLDSQLTAFTKIPSQKIAEMRSQGSTNHEDAFIKAINVLSANSGKEKIMILFTDGDSNLGKEGFSVAQQAKDRGITIYCIGYNRNMNFNIQNFEKWASAPSSAHVFITPKLEEIETAFTAIIQNIAKPGATNISITDTVHSCFEITGIAAVSKGTGKVLSSNQIKWDIDSLGMTKHESATCTFTVRQKGDCSGEILINEKTEYQDSENNIVQFLSPIVKVECKDTSVIPEPCPPAVDVTVDGCKDFIQYDVGEIELSSLGRIIQIDLTLKSICPGKEVALAVLLYEKDDLGNEYSRGMKTLLIPAHSESGCEDIKVRCIRFVVPDLSSHCEKRNFIVRAFGNYTNTDFICCK